MARFVPLDLLLLDAQLRSQLQLAKARGSSPLHPSTRPVTQCVQRQQLPLARPQGPILFRHETVAIHVHRVLRRREAYSKSSRIGHEVPAEEGVKEWRDCDGLPRVRPARSRIVSRFTSRGHPKRSSCRRVPLACTEFLALCGCLNRRRVMPTVKVPFQPVCRRMRGSGWRAPG